MDTITIHTSLELDSILRFYKWEERITCHELILGKKTNYNTNKIEKVCKWIEENRWIAPKMRYHPNETTEVLFFIEHGVYIPIHEYEKYYPKIVNNFKQLKIK